MTKKQIAALKRKIKKHLAAISKERDELRNLIGNVQDLISDEGDVSQGDSQG